MNPPPRQPRPIRPGPPFGPTTAVLLACLIGACAGAAAGPAALCLILCAPVAWILGIVFVVAFDAA